VLLQEDVRLSGTFLTNTGDYRYLAGWVRGGEMSLSCFDGAHAFLFAAKLQPDGALAGDFWSGNWHHETWTAKRDEHAELADPFAQTKWNGSTKLADLAFADLDGKKRSLGEFAGKATLLVVFGSWCPNCNDEAALLRELEAKYRERGLAILGLAFELTGEPARDAEQVRIFAKRHGLALPFFLCGTADKDEATKALGLVDRVRAFPTTIFVGADGLPKAIHSGFAGPATGEEHQKLRRDFEARIEALLAGPATPR
jgi:thiol-disulfide isomerase/thioredoxin